MKALLIVGVCAATILAQGAQSDMPENLARRAKISADSEYSADYRAQFVGDGRIAGAGSQEDGGQSWCVNGNTRRNGASISFEWEKPVTIAEIVYYGRTAWMNEECWRNYELVLDGAAQPLLTGEFKMRPGPQRIKLPAPRQVSKLTLNFTSSYGGQNPGAAEIQVFASSPTDQQLARSMEPPAPTVAPAYLRELVVGLSKTHGKNYAKAAEHVAALDGLERQSMSGTDVKAELAQLQREVLLFDVDQLLVIQRHEITASHVYTYHNEGFRAGGGLYVIPAHQRDASARELIASPEGQILDCDLSYDGKTVLFSWRQHENEGYHLWTINIDGSGLKQLTSGEWHDYNACWLPDGGIAFVSTRSGPQFAYCWNSPVGIVHRMEANGSNVRKLSANYLNDFTPYVLDNGKIIYSRWEYVDRPAIPIQSLWTIHPDGTGLSVFYGNRVISPATFMEARSVPGTDLILCTMTGHNGPTRGAIGLIDRSKGVNAQESIQNLTPDVVVPGVTEGDGNFWGAKPYSCPVPLDGTRFLVSARGPVLVRNIAGTCTSIALPQPVNGLQCFSAQPVRARVRPPVIASTLPETNAPLARLYVQDVYNGLEPHVKRGEVKRLRVVREMPKTVRINPEKRAFGFQFPVISAGATYAGKDVLGEVEVADDGSAYFEVPSGVPIYFMALDAHGRAVQRMRSFTHLMPGETQGCIGCHESRSEVSRPQPAPAAVGRAFQKLTPPEWGTGGFDYAKVVQPVLDQHCSKCHSGPTPDGKIDLSGDKTDFFNVSYEVLARGRKQSGEAQYDSPYVSWIPSYNGFETNILQVTPKSWGSPKSKLADLLLLAHPDRHGKPQIQMDDASIRRVLAWIDLNIPYYGSSETTHPENIGSRRIYPPGLDKVLAEVASRRCAQCHKNGVPRQFWTRLENAQWNSFLMAPLAKVAGGSGACGETVFKDTTDPDYQSILKAFEPALAELREHPRMDMSGARCATVNRSCK